MSEFRECLTLAILCWIWHEVEKDKLVRLLAAGSAFCWMVAAIIVVL